MNEYPSKRRPEFRVGTFRVLPESGQTLLAGEAGDIVHRVGEGNHRLAHLQRPGADGAVDGDHPGTMLQKQFKIPVIIIVNAIGHAEFQGHILYKFFIR